MTTAFRYCHVIRSNYNNSIHCVHVHVCAILIIVGTCISKEVSNNYVASLTSGLLCTWLQKF